MGLLDDAIREHLDLMRRRGADPAEIARKEQEAFGPIVRASQRPAGADDDGADAHDDPHAGEPGHEPGLAVDPGIHTEDHPHPVDPPERHEGVHGDPLVPTHHAPLHADAPAHVEPAEAADESAAAPAGAGADSHAPESGPHAPVADPRGADTADPGADDLHHDDITLQPTTEYSVEDHLDDEPDTAHPAHEPADVLEETPDFLQETPEHDRLWFEQRPPRDFDFDG